MDMEQMLANKAKEDEAWWRWKMAQAFMAATIQKGHSMSNERLAFSAVQQADMLIKTLVHGQQAERRY